MAKPAKALSEGRVLGRKMVEIIRGYVERQIVPLQQQIGALERRVATLERRPRLVKPERN